MVILETLLLTLLLLVSCCYYLLSLRAARHFFAAPSTPAGALPPVSVFKPLKGAPPGLYDHLASFCRLDYPTVQFLFGVRDPHDPAVAVVRRLQRDFPRLDITLAVNPEIIGSNYKVSTLHRLWREAKHDIFVVSDSDVRIAPGALTAIVPALQPAEVGLVTCPYRGGSAGPLPALIESLMVNTSFTPQVLIASQVEKTAYAFGALIAVKRRCVDAIGGFAALADYLADDYYLGLLVTRAGYAAKIVPHVVETHPDAATMRGLFLHQVRWARTQRLCRPAGYLGILITYGTVWASLSLLLWRQSPLLVALSLATLGLRLFSAAVLDKKFLRSPLPLSGFLLVPLADLFSFVVWRTGLRGDTVRWGEYTFRVRSDGKMARVPGATATAVAPEQLSPNNLSEPNGEEFVENR